MLQSGKKNSSACQGHPESAVATLSDAEITQTQSLLGTIASAVPGYDKLDPHCNGFTCNAGSSPGTSGTCDSQFIAQSKTAYCGVRASVSLLPLSVSVPCSVSTMIERAAIVEIVCQCWKPHFSSESRVSLYQALTAAQCNVIKGSKIDYKKEIGFAADVVGASLAGGPAGGLAAALTLLQAELKTQYEAFVSNAGPVSRPYSHNHFCLKNKDTP